MRRPRLDEYGDPIVAECLACGKDLPDFETQYCCNGNYCDCGGWPINEPICEECEEGREEYE